MSEPCYLTRARLRRDAPAAALARVLLPENPDERVGNAHRLLWTLFADAPDRRRDFLWREEGAMDLAPGRAAFLVLSARPPQDPHGLFDLDEAKLFAPSLASGDRLAFSLRANPVVTRPSAASADGKSRRLRHDVVMDRLRELPKGSRGTHRLAAMEEAGQAWLEAQGARHGFTLLGAPRIDGYDQRRIRREGGRPIRFSVLDFDGLLEVREPDLFLGTLRRGFGKAKAWGCGLMLIRRA
jgi:CRISPR system Cascade subunit CasE